MVFLMIVFVLQFACCIYYEIDLEYFEIGLMLGCHCPMKPHDPIDLFMNRKYTWKDKHEVDIINNLLCFDISLLDGHWRFRNRLSRRNFFSVKQYLNINTVSSTKEYYLYRILRFFWSWRRCVNTGGLWRVLMGAGGHWWWLVGAGRHWWIPVGAGPLVGNGRHWWAVFWRWLVPYGIVRLQILVGTESWWAMYGLLCMLMGDGHWWGLLDIVRTLASLARAWYTLCSRHEIYSLF